MRFASVYREFKDLKEFLRELLPLVRSHLTQEDLDLRAAAAALLPQGTVEEQ